MKIPRVVILAGGIGNRFKPFTVDKTLMPFMGKPILQYTLEMLERVGCQQVLVTTNEENNLWIKAYQSKKLQIDTKIQPKPLGMGDAMIHLADKIGNEPIIVINAGDIVDDSLLTSLFEKISDDTYGVITGMKVKSHYVGGYLMLKDNHVISIIEKPPKGEEPSDMVNLVFHYFKEPHIFIEKIKKITDHNDDQYERGLDILMKEHNFDFVEYNGYWQKLKFNYYVLQMVNLFLTHKCQSFKDSSAEVSPSASIIGNVYIDEGAKILSGATIVGPAYIGKRVIIGQNTLVRESMIEHDTVVGFGSEVARSYVGPTCNLHHNFIGDSILESDINPSYNTHTANWRLFDNQPVSVKLPDQKLETSLTKLGAIIAKGVLMGTNCSIMPGVTIGAYAKIYPGTIVHAAVKAYTTVKNYQNQQIVDEEHTA